MPFVFKLLKQAQAAGAAASIPIYTVGIIPTSTIISNIRFYNSSGVAASATINFRSTSSAGTTSLAKITCNAASVTVFNTELTLASSNVIEVSTSATMDIVACGVDRIP